MEYLRNILRFCSGLSPEFEMGVEGGGGEGREEEERGILHQSL